MSKNTRNSLTRRKFLKGIGGSAVAVTAAGHLAACPRLPAQLEPIGPRASEKQIKIGIVGGGFGASFQWHLDPNCKVAAFCDLREDRLKRLTDGYGPGQTYKSFREFLKHPQLDAVAVFTPAPLHVWMATEAMKAGKHVISAVPAGMSVEELEQLLECVKKTGLKYMMAETSYYRAEIMTCQEWSQQGKFGKHFLFGGGIPPRRADPADV